MGVTFRMLNCKFGVRPNVLGKFPPPAESARLLTNTKAENVTIVGPDTQIVVSGLAPLGEKAGALAN